MKTSTFLPGRSAMLILWSTGVILLSLAGTSWAFSLKVNRVGSPSLHDIKVMMAHKNQMNDETKLKNRNSSLKNSSLFFQIDTEESHRMKISKLRLRKVVRKVLISAALSTSLWFKGTSQISHAVTEETISTEEIKLLASEEVLLAEESETETSVEKPKNVKTLVIAAGTAMIAMKVGSSFMGKGDDEDDRVQVIENSFTNTGSGKGDDDDDEERLRALEERKIAAEKKLAGKIKAENRLRAKDEAVKAKEEKDKAIAKAAAEARILAEKEEAARIRAEKEALKLIEKRKQQEEEDRKKAEEAAIAAAKAEEAALELAHKYEEATAAQAKAEEEEEALVKAEEEAAAALAKAEEEAAVAQAKAEEEEEALAKAKEEVAAAEAKAEEEAVEMESSKREQAAEKTAEWMQDEETKEYVEEKSLEEKYASISDPSERAFQILVDLGMVELHGDPSSPEYDHSDDDEFVSS